MIANGKNGGGAQEIHRVIGVTQRISRSSCFISLAMQVEGTGVPVHPRRGSAARPRPLEQGARRAAGKRTKRFSAASSVHVIRVDPTPPPAHQCACHVPPNRIRTRRDVERSERTS
jgi:hypothetical protein